MNIIKIIELYLKRYSHFNIKFIILFNLLDFGPGLRPLTVVFTVFVGVTTFFSAVEIVLISFFSTFLSITNDLSFNSNLSKI